VAFEFKDHLTAPPATTALFLFSRDGHEISRHENLCQILDDLGERKNNNLRAINGSRGTDSVPGHLVFNHLQTFKTAVSFHFVPIPGASNFAHGAKLRLTTLRRAMFSGPAFCFSTSHMLDRDPFAPFGGGRRLSTAFSFLIRKQGFLCLLIPAAARGRRRHATPPARPATGQASRRGRLARPG